MRSCYLRASVTVLCATLMAGCADGISTPELGSDGPAGPLMARSLEGQRGVGSFLVTGPGSGAGPHVKVFDGATTSPLQSFFPYSASFTGGVRVATGDVNGDGRLDIATAAGSGGGPHVKVIDGSTGGEVHSFFAFDPGFTGGVFVAAGDLNRDGHADILAGADAGGAPQVTAFNGATGSVLFSFTPYPAGFSGGIRVASGDVNGDGHDDIVTAPGAGGGPHVKVFSGSTGEELMSFFAYEPTFTGGVFVAAGDVNGDGVADIVTGAGAGGGPHVKVFDGTSGSEIASFFAYPVAFTGGVTVAAGDVNGDGRADIVRGAGAGAGPHVKVFSGADNAELASFLAYDPNFLGGVFVAAGVPNASATRLVTIVREAIESGTLVGDGPTANAAHRLAAWRSMLATARDRLEAGNVRGACAQLTAAYLRADGAPRPPDFVSGPAREAIADLILTLMEEAGCDR